MKPISNPCCCCSLKTGALIVAILEIVGGLLFIGQSLRFLKPEFFPYMDKVVIEQHDKLGPSDDAVHSTYLYVLHVTVFTVNVFATLFGFLLLYAIRKQLTPLMLTWIIFRILTLLVSIVLISVGYFIKYSEKELVEGLLGVAINSWIISIIFYLRKAALLAEGDSTTDKPRFKESKPLHVLRTDYTYKIPI